MAAVIIGMVFVVHKNYEQYTTTMLAIAAAAHVVLFIGYCIVPETLLHVLQQQQENLNINNGKNTKKSSMNICKNASPVNTIRFFNQYTELRRLAIVILTSCLSISCLTIIQGYTVAAYGWTQTKSVAVMVAIGAFAGPAIVLSPLIIAKNGALRSVCSSDLLYLLWNAY